MDQCYGMTIVIYCAQQPSRLQYERRTGIVSVAPRCQVRTLQSRSGDAGAALELYGPCMYREYVAYL